MGYKNFVAGEEALAADVNTYLMSQTVARFPNAAARTAALTAPAVNQLTSRDDRPGAIERWTGSAWEEVTAGAELIYAQITTPLAVVNLASGSAHTVVDGGARTYDGSPVMLEMFSPYVTSPSNGVTFIGLWDGATYLAVLGQIGVGFAGAVAAALHLRYRFTPSAGSHAYKTGAWVSSGSGQVSAGTGTGGAQVPGFLRITRA